MLDFSGLCGDLRCVEWEDFKVDFWWFLSEFEEMLIFQGFDGVFWSVFGDFLWCRKWWKRWFLGILSKSVSNSDKLEKSSFYVKRTDMPFLAYSYYF